MIYLVKFSFGLLDTTNNKAVITSQLQKTLLPEKKNEIGFIDIL